ncbi:MAG: hypothetical protein SFV81_25475 [Pirellulaceae bacterium]|nr:hypothetical protein [Pirellulaceae bacterium]
MKLRTSTAVVALCMLPQHAWGHEGHGVPGHGNTVAHYAFEPLHLPLAIIACAALIWLAMQLRTRWTRVAERA